MRSSRLFTIVKRKDRTDCNNHRGVALVTHGGKSVVENRRVSPYQLLRVRGNTTGGTVRLPPRTINDRQGVRRAPVARARTTEETPPVRVLHRSAGSVRLCRPRAAVEGTHTLWRAN